MSTALLATLKAVFVNGSAPIIARPAVQRLELPQYVAGHILVECVNSDGSAHPLTSDTLLLGVRLHPTDAVPTISLQATNMTTDPTGHPATNWARFELVPGHWIGVVPRTYEYDVVSLFGGDPDDRSPGVPASQLRVTDENIHPGDNIQQPESLQPLAQGPAGPTGATGPQGPAGTFTNPQPLPFSDGANTHTLELGAVADSVWFKIAAGDSGRYVDFYGTFSSQAVNPGKPNDDVLNFGPNLGPGGSPVDPTKAAGGFSLEALFQGGHLQQEFHNVWWPPNSITGPLYRQTRYISFEGHDDDGSTALYIRSTEISIGSGATASDASSILINPTETFVFSPSGPTGGLSLLLDDGSVEAILAAADGSGHYASLTNVIVSGIFGMSVLDAGIVRLSTNGNVGVQVNGSDTTIYQPNDHNQFMTLDGNGVYCYVGNASRLRVTLAGIGVTGVGAISGSFGVFGVTPPAQQTLGATPTGAEIRAALVAYGLVVP